MKDRISSLPDEVISHILSFLPTKVAATTSVLSKRWKPLWLSLLTLSFDDATFQTLNSFLDSLYFLFFSRDISLPIQSFHLRCSNVSTSNSHDINRFIYAVAQRKIQNLKLELSRQVNFPPCIFSCRTLVVLHLENTKVNDDLSHLVVDFPLLKTLRLSSIIVQSIGNLLMLLFGCPILEELHAEYLNLNNHDLSSLADKAIKKRFPILPNVIRASITNSSFSVKHCIALICWPKVQDLRVELDLQIYSRYRKSYSITCIELILKHNHCDKWFWSLETLKHCPLLQSLTINEKCRRNEEEVVDNWTDSAIIPECLSTHLRTCLFKDYKYTECGLQFAKYIMQNSKVMSTMSIKSASSISEHVKHQMFKKLASGIRASSTFKLLID